MKTQLIILAGIFSFLTACSSGRSAYRLLPSNNQNLIWRNGESAVSDTAADLYCMVTSALVNNQKLNFNMRFHNDGNEIILLDPATFYTQQTLKNGMVKDAFAYTPEQLLVQYNQQVSNSKGVFIFAAIAAIIVGAAVIAVTSGNKKNETSQTQTQQTDDEKRQQERAERNRRECDREREQQYSTIPAEPAQPSAEQLERDSIQRNMLRKHSLLPDESISGIVVFPMLDDMAKVNLYVPVKDSTKLRFSYDAVVR